MRKKIIAGNWKMNGSKATTKQLLEAIKANCNHLDCEVIIFPPFVYLDQTQNLLQGTGIHWGAQNVASKAQGAYTGEVSAAMLTDFGCQYVLIGHSERRQYYYETGAETAAKCRLAVDNKITPVLCIGETLEERAGNQTWRIIKNQLNAILTLENWQEMLQNAILAYEPVWAIGTGKTASPEEAQEVHAFIRSIIAEKDKSIAAKLPILYGGSVKANNAKGLFAMADIDGALVGGASLEANEFTEICQCSL